MTRRMQKRAFIALAVVIVGVAAVVGWWLQRDDAPDEVSLEAAAAQITGDAPVDDTTAAPASPDDSVSADTVPADTSPAASASGSDEQTSGSAGVEGRWTVDTSIGEFSYTESTGTFVGFRVREELVGVGAIDAVGRTPVVSGTLTIEGDEATGVEIVADMTALTTDDRRRDDKVQDALGTGEHPTATFRLTTPIAIGDAIATGAAVAADATGELTVRGITRPVVVPLEARLVDDVIVVVGSVRIEFADYGVEVPSAPIVLSADDFGDLELQLFFRRA